MTKPKVAICIPSSETWKAQFAFQAFCLAVESTNAGIDLVPINHRGGDAAENRNNMVRLGREQKVEWFLFFDADMTFPPDALVRLLRWNIDVVGADYRYRAHPFTKIGTNPVDSRPYPLDHVDPTEGLVERGMLGLGLLLVRAGVFEKLPAPWFARTWIPEQATPDNPYGFATDDCYFCHYCRYHGFKVWCDMGLTQQVQHIGEIYVPWQMKGRA